MRRHGASTERTAEIFWQSLRSSLPWIGGVALVIVLDMFERSAIMNMDRVGIARAIDFVLGAAIETLGHIVTAVLCLVFLTSIPIRVPAQFAGGTLVGAMLIDLDHIPEWLGWSARTEASVRPVLHSVLPLVVIVAFAAVWLPARWRAFEFGIGFGTFTHLARDSAMGGIPLFWPLTDQAVSMPYSVYAGLTLGLALGIGWFAWRDRSPGNAAVDLRGLERRIGS